MKVSDLLAASARRFPNHPALVYRDRPVSFRELDRRTNQVARALHGIGVGKGDALALYARNSPEWVEVYFGASKAGAVVVPVNFRLRGAEVGYIVEHARPSAVICDEELAVEVPELGPGVRRLAFGDEYAAWRKAARAEPVEVELGSREVHSVCYTSGTTGFPKGAVMTQANVVVGAHYMAVADVGFTRDDVFLNVAPFCHRAGWPRMVQAVGVGATQVIVQGFEPAGILSAIDRHHVTTTALVPTMVRLVEKSPELERHDLSSLRQLVLGGEAAPLPVIRRVFELFPQAELVSVFASTEAGLVSLLGSDQQLERPESAGLPFAGVELRILDDQGRALPAGDVGEIAVRSGEPGEAGVMLEYLRDPEANARAFVEGWLRTGDAGFVDEEGYLFLTDRKKDMILTGGLNVYSKEVENALAEHPAVAEAAVVGRADPLWGESVVAFVVVRPDIDASAASEEALVAHCRERLASYKKPREIRFVSELPRSSVGKILKYRLRELLEREEE